MGLSTNCCSQNGTLPGWKELERRDDDSCLTNTISMYYNYHSQPINHMKKILSLLFILFFYTGAQASNRDLNAGIVAAREMGLTNYVEFKSHGKTDSAALFFWRGNWWVYHPSFGSMKTALED